MKYCTYKMKLVSLNVLAVVLILVMMLITFLIRGDLAFIDDCSWSWFIFFMIWFVLHELLHGVGFLILGKVSPKNVVFGAELEKGIFYCMCKEKISKLNILIALVFPLFFIGILTYVISLVTNNSLLLFLSLINIGGSIGDIVMTYDILRMPNDIMYLDLDDTTSFTIVSQSDLHKKKYFGIKLYKHGTYDETIKARDYTKLKISKGSIWIFIIFVLAVLIWLIDLFF